MSRYFAIACIVLFALLTLAAMYATLAHIAWYIKGHESKSMTESIRIVEELNTNGFLNIDSEDQEYGDLIREIGDIADTSMHAVNSDLLAHIYLGIGSACGFIVALIGVCLNQGSKTRLSQSTQST